MRSTHRFNHFCQMTPGHIYMHFLEQKLGFWPVRLLEISQHHSKTKKPLKAKFEVFNNSKSHYKRPRTIIQLDLQNSPPQQLIPFESVYNKNYNMQNAIESGNYHRKDSSEFQMVMRQATKAFQDQLKTPSMYQMLKKQIKLDSINKNPKNQSHFPFSEILSNKVQFTNTRNPNKNPELKDIQIATVCITNLDRNDVKNGYQKINEVDYSRKVHQPSKRNQDFINLTEQSKKWVENKSKKELNQKERAKVLQKLRKKVMKSVIQVIPKSSTSSTSRSQKYKDEPNNPKRGHTQIINIEGQIRGLQSTKKRRKGSKNNTTVIQFVKDQPPIHSQISILSSSQSQLARKSMKQCPKNIEQKSQLIKQQYLTLLQNASSLDSKTSKSNKSTNNKAKNLKFSEKPSKNEQKNIYPKTTSIVCNKISNQTIELKENKCLSSVKSQAILNRGQSRAKVVSKNQKKMKRLLSETNIIPNSKVQIKIQKQSSQKSVISSRTRSKTVFNPKVKHQSPQKKLTKYQPSIKIQPSIQKSYSAPKQKNLNPKYKQTNGRNIEQKNVNIKTKKLSKKLPYLKPSSKLQRQTELYTSQNGQNLNVENFFFIFKQLFDNPIMNEDFIQVFKRGRKIEKNDLKINQKVKPRIYSCIMNEDSADKIQKQLQDKRNECQKSQIDNQEVPKKQQENQEQIFSTKHEQETNENQPPFKLLQKPTNNQNKIEKIHQQKDQKHSQSKLSPSLLVNESKVKKEECSISFDELLQSKPNDSEASSKTNNQTSSQRLSLKYQMKLVQSFNDLLHLIKKQLSQNKKRNHQKQNEAYNQMDLENIESENQFQSVDNKMSIVFLIQKDLTINQQLTCGIGFKKKNKVNKKQSKKLKIMSKIDFNNEPQSMKTNFTTNNLIQEFLFAWPIQKVTLHAIFINLRNLYFSVSLNQSFIHDLIRYKGSQNQFFNSLFPNLRFIGNQIIQSNKNSMISSNESSRSSSVKNNKKRSQILPNMKKYSNKNLTKSSKSRINSTLNHCGHQFCNKIPQSYQNILQNLSQLLSMQVSMSNLNSFSSSYTHFITKQAQLILNQFEINFKYKENKDSLFLDKNTFRDNCLGILSKVIEQKKFQTSCIYLKILILLVKVFQMFSEKTFRSQSFEGKSKTIGIELFNGKNQMINDDNKNLNGSILKNQKRQQGKKLNGKSQKIKVVRHPDQKRFAQITASPFSIEMEDENYERISDIPERKSLNSSGITEFDRNTIDFTSFLTNIVPNVDVEKHKRNFRNSKQQIGSSYHYQINNSSISSFRQYSQKTCQQQVDINHNVIDKRKISPYPSSNSVTINNIRSEQSMKEKNLMSFHVPNQLQVNSNTNTFFNLQKNEQSFMISEKQSQMMGTSQDEKIQLLKQEIFGLLDKFESKNSTQILIQH